MKTSKKDDLKAALALLEHDQEHFQEEPPFKRRALRDGEWIEASGLGIPGLMLTGPAVQVDEYKDGTIIPIIPRITSLFASLFRHLATDDAPLLGKHLPFLRGHMGLTQAELAERLGVSRKTINQYENEGGPLPQDKALGVRFLALRFLIDAQPPSVRQRLVRPKPEVDVLRIQRGRKMETLRPLAVEVGVSAAI